MTDFPSTTQSACCWDVPHTHEAVAEARALTRKALADWGLGALADDAELVVSELVTNAIRHGAAPVILALGVVGSADLVGTVTDGGPGLPRIPPPVPGLEDTGGRGLAIVRELVTRWGVWPDSGGIGKTIWFTLTAG